MAFWCFAVAEVLHQAGLSQWLPLMASVAKSPPSPPSTPALLSTAQLAPEWQGDDFFCCSFPHVCHGQPAGDLLLQRGTSTNRSRLCSNPCNRCNFASFRSEPLAPRHGL